MKPILAAITTVISLLYSHHIPTSHAFQNNAPHLQRIYKSIDTRYEYATTIAPVITNNNNHIGHTININQKNRITELKSTRNNNQRRNSSSSAKNEGVTSTLISSLAVVALKLRLESQTSVKCTVQSSSKELLLKQSIGPVSVRGKDWSSPLRLTCRVIQADVATCMLDMNSVLKKRKLILLEPAKGTAMIAFNNADFGNFLKHPLLKAQVPSLSSNSSTRTDDNDNDNDNEEERRFVFQQDRVEIQNEANDGNGQVIFYGKCMGQKWECILKQGVEGGNGRTADIEISHQSDDESDKKLSEGEIASIESELTIIVTNFFNQLVFELDGTFLTYKDLKFHATKKSGGGAVEPNILFALDITVRKFPSPGLAF